MYFDLIDLRLFLHTVECGNITAGAQRSHLSLPAASARIRAMENATPLICANRTGVETYAGAEATFRGESQIVGPMGEVWTCATKETSLGLSIIDPAAHVLKANPMCDDLMAEASRYALAGPHLK